ncbi:hypothetical protein BOTBODRAFT_578656 [Botryobasidium botryosum FD-172 SS1]|uniref:Uncharacterized protein n=1 Tax=Botryobasidium botryosum (strain FD-172 SS1) TaxID=930990 RepID=A0A067MSB9_BOTB1|nr:hypothetical protein BOTBODRAFT_578656 [Botryobasidium botryosum FD-172 SS1]
MGRLRKQTWRPSRCRRRGQRGRRLRGDEQARDGIKLSAQEPPPTNPSRPPREIARPAAPRPPPRKRTLFLSKPTPAKC